MQDCAVRVWSRHRPSEACAMKATEGEGYIYCDDEDGGDSEDDADNNDGGSDE